MNKIDIDSDALRILKETQERMSKEKPDIRKNYSAAIRYLAAK